MARQEANWVEIDPSTLDGNADTLYQAYKDAYKAMKAARIAFETRMSVMAELPEGKRLVFGYNFGKLSVAVVDDDRKPAAKAKPSSTLAAFLAAQAASGRAA